MTIDEAARDITKAHTPKSKVKEILEELYEEARNKGWKEGYESAQYDI